MITGIHHAQITVPKGTEEQARAFYCGVLGLPEIEKPESLKGRGGFWLQVGDRQVHVGTEDVFDRLATKSHIAYQVDDVAVDARTEHVRPHDQDAGRLVLACRQNPGCHRL